jgi:mercuric ion binding protein
MKRTIRIAAAALALGLGGILASTPFWPGKAQSDQSDTMRTATFNVDKMTCALCPLTVKTAMEGVEGVQSVDVDFGAKTATVVFDPTLTSAEAIAAASTDIGYPAREAG